MIASLAILATVGAQAAAVHSHSREVTATAYNSVKAQTSDHPWVGAWNNHLRPGEKVIAVSKDLEKYGLTNGAKVKVQGLAGTYTVRDRMNPRWHNRIDVWMGTNVHKALNWGKKDVNITWNTKA